MSKSKLILVGGGGHCKSVIDVAERAGYEIYGVIDEYKQLGETILGYPVLGGDDAIEKYVGEASFLITVGFITNPQVRMHLYNKIISLGGVMATVISPYAYVSPYASIGQGTVVMHNACIGVGCVVGDNVIINTFSNIEHESNVGNHCHISTGAMINGSCVIGERVFVGSQSTIANQVAISSDVIVGAGSLVRKSIDTKGVYAGNPLKFIRANEK